jgi:hypothetical protein
MQNCTSQYIRGRYGGDSPRRGGGGRPNGGRCGRAVGADISTGVQCLETGGDFPLLMRLSLKTNPFFLEKKLFCRRIARPASGIRA